MQLTREVEGRAACLPVRVGSDVTHKRRCYSLDEGSSVVLEKLGPATATATVGESPKEVGGKRRGHGDAAWIK